jgi:hypothetical protein
LLCLIALVEISKTAAIISLKEKKSDLDVEEK